MVGVSTNTTGLVVCLYSASRNMAAWNYPLDVISIADTYPDLSAYLDRLNIRASKQAGDMFDPAAVVQAENTPRH